MTRHYSTNNLVDHYAPQRRHHNRYGCERRVATRRTIQGAPRHHNRYGYERRVATRRTIHHTPVQRPQQQRSVNPQASTQTSRTQQNQQTQDGLHRNKDELFPPTSRFTSGMDDCHHRGQGDVGQLSGSGQHQTGNIEEFPPLGRNGNDDTNHDQRCSLMQNAAFGGFSSTNTFDVPNTVQTRYGLPNAPSSQSDTSQSLQQKLEAIQARTAAIEEQVKVRQEEERRKRLDEKMAEELLSLRAMIKQAEEKEREVRRQLFAFEIMYA